MQSTREKLLRTTAQEMLRHGFQGTRVDIVLEKVGVAKGALYHHFKDKISLGYAVVDEVIRELMIEFWLKPMESSTDPLEGISKTIKAAFSNPSKKMIETGCPLNNLAQEMSSVDEGFRQRIDDIYVLWRENISAALKQGQDMGIVRSDIHIDKVASFIVASIAGCIGTAKNARDPQLLQQCGETLVEYLESLRQ